MTAIEQAFSADVPSRPRRIPVSPYGVGALVLPASLRPSPGTRSAPPSTVTDELLADARRRGRGRDARVVTGFRLPLTATGIVAGAALEVAGVIAYEAGATGVALAKV
ncbi:hypothetical protein ACH4UV_17965 [Streptomyces sp. NPDC020802]|uniref:hypothetical protein n=1 Tax=Streptomyces sp. NPDC020802 TaxID=3365094 RepID=UPI003794E214